MDTLEYSGKIATKIFQHTANWWLKNETKQDLPLNSWVALGVNSSTTGFPEVSTGYSWALRFNQLSLPVSPTYIWIVRVVIFKDYCGKSFIK